MTQLASTLARINVANRQCDGTVNAGRKGIAYDWQSLLAAEGVAAIEAELAGSGLAELGLAGSFAESAE